VKGCERVVQRNCDVCCIISENGVTFRGLNSLAVYINLGGRNSVSFHHAYIRCIVGLQNSLRIKFFRNPLENPIPNSQQTLRCMVYFPTENLPVVGGLPANPWSHSVKHQHFFGGDPVLINLEFWQSSSQTKWKENM